MPHGRVLGIDRATQMFHVMCMDDTGDVVSETLHEKYPKPGVFRGEELSLFFHAKQRIERLSENMKMFGRTWPVPCRGTSLQTAFCLSVSTTPQKATPAGRRTVPRCDMRRVKHGG